MLSRIVLAGMVTAGVVTTPVFQAQAKEKVIASGACALALGATILAACRFGASINDKTCRNSGMDQVHRACGKLSRCKNDCKDAYKNVKDELKAAKRNCKKACKKHKKFTARFKCKRACGKKKRKKLKAHKKARSTCKKQCKTDYKSKPCKKARAKLVAWAMGMGAGFAAVIKFCAVKK